jgi:hypothetical protein
LALFILPLILGGGTVWLVVSSILGLALGGGFYASKSSKYRNKGARHTYEKETKNELNISSTKDKYIETDTECSSSTISGVNNYSIRGEYTEVNK